MGGFVGPEDDALRCRTDAARPRKAKGQTGECDPGLAGFQASSPSSAKCACTVLHAEIAREAWSPAPRFPKVSSQTHACSQLFSSWRFFGVEGCHRRPLTEQPRVQSSSSTHGFMSLSRCRAKMADHTCIVEVWGSPPSGQRQEPQHRLAWRGARCLLQRGLNKHVCGSAPVRLPGLGVMPVARFESMQGAGAMKAHPATT